MNSFIQVEILVLFSSAILPAVTRISAKLESVQERSSRANNIIAICNAPRPPARSITGARMATAHEGAPRRPSARVGEEWRVTDHDMFGTALPV